MAALATTEQAPKVVQTFRVAPEEATELRAIADRLGVSKTDVIRAGIVAVREGRVAP